MTKDLAPDNAPVWSPDGQKIGFYSVRSGNQEIWVMPVDGGPARQLTDGSSTGTELWFVSWSPDGEEIAFNKTTGVSTVIYVMSVGGGEARQVTHTTEPDDWRPVWSPDGEWLVFENVEGLWRVPMSGGEPELLAGTRPTGNPRWSRDGKDVYFLGRENIWVFSLKDRRKRPMAELSGRRGRLMSGALAVDGRYLYFA